MATEPGRQIGIAFKGIRQCHQDVGRLIADFDDYMTNRGFKRMWGQDAVTSGMSRAAYAPYWMAKKLYRLYLDDENTPNVVDGINIRFFSEDGSLDEPRLIVGRIAYDVPPTQSVENIAQEWDLDVGYRKWCNASSSDLGKPLSFKADSGRVKWLSAIALDLYSIRSLDDLTASLAQVRKQFEV